MKVLIACEESQIITLAFRRMGHEAFSCDLIPCSGGHPEWHYQCDVLEILNDGWDMMIAHPVCTRLTNAGARWLKVAPPGKTLDQMWSELAEGAAFYRKLRDAKIPLKAIENPIMHCHAKKLVQPGFRQVVQPWWFGDPFFKATGLELIGLPPLTATNKLVPPKPGTDEHKKWSAVHRASPGPDRAKARSKSFPGMAEAMALQWGRIIQTG